MSTDEIKYTTLSPAKPFKLQIDRSHFIGRPRGRFVVEEMELVRPDDPQWWVKCDCGFVGSELIAGLYDSYYSANDVAYALNKIWFALPKLSAYAILEAAQHRAVVCGYPRFDYVDNDSCILLHRVNVGFDDFVEVVGDPDNGGYEWVIRTKGGITHHSNSGWGSTTECLKAGLAIYEKINA